MICAYDKKYLDDAMRNLGEAIDYAVNVCGMTSDEFMDMFIVSGLARQFGVGVPKYIAGMSGIELVCEVVSCSGKEVEFREVEIEYQYSSEYWGGWILAYYQWATGRSFQDIREHISVQEILDRYSTLHEASEDRCVDAINVMIQKKNPSTQLQRLRKIVGYSQKKLAEKSGVTLRMIQQYEQRAKDINKASGSNLVALAQVLGCRVEDLMEHDNEKR